MALIEKKRNKAFRPRGPDLPKELREKKEREDKVFTLKFLILLGVIIFCFIEYKNSRNKRKRFFKRI